MTTVSPTFEISTDTAHFTIKRPEHCAGLDAIKSLAREFLIDAFATNYIQFHQQSKSQDPIEKWLNIGSPLKVWLDEVFSNEWKEFESKKVDLLLLFDNNEKLAGWLSHRPVDEKGDCYWSLCCLAPHWRNKRVASTVFSEMKGRVKELFPGVKEIKLVTRRINEFAQKLYLGAGFIKDETIDPKTYGESLDERYVGYRLKVS